MIDLHEDPGADGFYLYQYGNDSKAVSEGLIQTVGELGYPIEKNVSMVILKTKNGIIDAPMWGLWYMRLSRQLSITNYYRLNNSTMVYTVETPTRLPLADRLLLQETAVTFFLNSHILNHTAN
jgi:hypothetical protein